MAEESQASVSKEEIEKINKEIEQKEVQTVDAIKRDVVASVKKELEDAERAKQLQAESERLAKELEEAKKAQEEQINALKEEFKKELQNVKDMRQSVPSTDSPFKPGDTVVNDNHGVNLNDPEVVSSIEEESRIKFIRDRGLPEDWGTR